MSMYKKPQLTNKGSKPSLENNMDIAKRGSKSNKM